MTARILLAALVGLAAPALPGVAQTLVEGPQPVDQAVGDLDPLSVSLRRVDPGNAQFSSRAELWRLPTGTQLPGVGAPNYLYREPGVIALIRQPSYFVYNPDVSGTGDGLTMNVAPSVDGLFRAVIPADTVFDLIYRPTYTLVRPEDDPNWTDTRLDGRYGPMSHQPLGARIDPRFATGNADLGPEASVNRQAPASPQVNVDRRLKPVVREIPSDLLQPGRPAPAAQDDDAPTASE